MPASTRGRVLLAAGLVLLLFLAGLGLMALRSLQRRSELHLQRVESEAIERGAQRAGWEVLADLAPERLRAAMTQAEPRLSLSRELELWHTKVALDLIVFDAGGQPLAAAPPELLDRAPHLGGDVVVITVDADPEGRATRALAGRQLEIANADGSSAATLSALPSHSSTAMTALAEPEPPGDLSWFDPLLLSFLGAITLAVLALLAFLVRTTNRLERTEALRRDLVADAGHELRTPLTNLRCQLEAAQDGMAPASPAMLRSLHDETMLLVRLVDDLRDLAAAEAGELTLRRAPTALADVALQTTQAMQAGFDARRVRLVAELDAPLPPLDADADRLGQVLRNLLDNARRHTPPGGCVRLTARAKGPAVELCVTDTGSGIAPEVLPRVFERGTRNSDGSGLGLPIVRSLVGAHGGTVRAESLPGEGARFTIRWPMA